MNHGADAVNITPAQLAAYIKALQGQDWSFEMSDDHAKWQAGKDGLEALRVQRKLIDPDSMIWNQWAPAEWQVKLASTEGSLA